MAAEYTLFPDRREEQGSLEAARMVLAAEPDPSSALLRLRRIDWNHPCLLVHRAPGEDRWSQVLLGLSTPELGEGDA